MDEASNHSERVLEGEPRVALAELGSARLFDVARRDAQRRRATGVRGEATGGQDRVEQRQSEGGQHGRRPQVALDPLEDRAEGDQLPRRVEVEQLIREPVGTDHVREASPQHRPCRRDVGVGLGAPDVVGIEWRLTLLGTAPLIATDRAAVVAGDRASDGRSVVVALLRPQELVRDQHPGTGRAARREQVADRHLEARLATGRGGHPLERGIEVADIGRTQDHLGEHPAERARFERDRSSLPVDGGSGHPTAAPEQVGDDITRPAVEVDPRRQHRWWWWRRQPIEHGQRIARFGVGDGSSACHRRQMLADARYAWPMRDPLIDLAPATPVPLHPSLAVARRGLAAVVADLLAVPDEALDRPWRWRGTDPDDIELRYGIYRIHERFEEAVGAIAVGRAGGPGDPIGPAVPALAAATAARWELHGALAPLGVSTWDADPGDGEWTIRQTLGHIISGQRSYGWLNAWFLSQPRDLDEVAYPPDGALPPEPTEEDEARGDPEAVVERLDLVVDDNIAAFAGLDGSAMRAAARWSGLHVRIDFRLGRYGSHIREHTIQVDKTLAMLGRRPTETERLVRLILATYGRLEALVVGRSGAALNAPFADGSSAMSNVTAAVTDACEIAGRVRASE